MVNACCCDKRNTDGIKLVGLSERSRLSVKNLFLFLSRLTHRLFAGVFIGTSSIDSCRNAGFSRADSNGRQLMATGNWRIYRLLVVHLLINGKASYLRQHTLLH